MIWYRVILKWWVLKLILQKDRVSHIKIVWINHRSLFLAQPNSYHLLIELVIRMWTITLTSTRMAIKGRILTKTSLLMKSTACLKWVVTAIQAKQPKKAVISKDWFKTIRTRTWVRKQLRLLSLKRTLVFWTQLQATRAWWTMATILQSIKRGQATRLTWL